MASPHHNLHGILGWCMEKYCLGLFCLIWPGIKVALPSVLINQSSIYAIVVNYIPNRVYSR